MTLLAGKVAVLYGGAGAMGQAVAHAFAREGATVVVTGRTPENVTRVADAVSAAGGTAESAVVDALDEEAVEAHVNDVAGRHGGVHISLNLISHGYTIGRPMADVAVRDFMVAVDSAIRTNLITGRAAARHMAQRGEGAILALTASPARRPLEHQGNFGVVGAAIEALCRQLAIDFGPQGVRVVCLRSAGSPDAPDVDWALSHLAELEGVTRPEFEARIADRGMLKRLPRLHEIAGLAVLVASDYASAMTGTVANGTCGEAVD